MLASDTFVSLDIVLLGSRGGEISMEWWSSTGTNERSSTLPSPNRDHRMEWKDELVDPMPLLAISKSALRSNRRHKFVATHQASAEDRSDSKAANTLLRLRAIFVKTSVDPIEVGGIEISLQVLEPVRFLHHDGRADRR